MEVEPPRLPVNRFTLDNSSCGGRSRLGLVGFGCVFDRVRRLNLPTSPLQGSAHRGLPRSAANAPAAVSTRVAVSKPRMGNCAESSTACGISTLRAPATCKIPGETVTEPCLGGPRLSEMRWSRRESPTEQLRTVSATCTCRDCVTGPSPRQDQVLAMLTIPGRDQET